ncbi:MAG: hypothetical protein EOP38_09420 [Rubrivivax sp.]|nr:MAG: hypothetical protein EOP38_09420 [Rubrivivax sp.]
MRTLSQNEVAVVAGAGTLSDLLAAVGKTLVGVNVVAKPTGSTDVTVKNNLVDVLVHVVWGK